MTKNCLKCNKEFSKSVFCSKKEWENRLYCSHSCANSVNSKGNNHCVGRTPWNKGISGKKGRNNPNYLRIEKQCLECGKNFTVKNYRKDIAKFCSAKCSSNHNNRGISTENERLRRNNDYKIWRELVYEKDNYTCQKCLIKGGEINAHHIQNFSDNKDLRLDIDNGITFCRECHYKFHSKYGFNKNNQAQIDSFLSSVAKEA